MIILYTSNCPKCKILKEKLNESNVEYVEQFNLEKLILNNISVVPVLELDNGILLGFESAMKYLEKEG